MVTTGQAEFAACLKLYHGLELLELHGMRPFYSFFHKVSHQPPPVQADCHECCGAGPFSVSSGLWLQPQIKYVAFT